MEDESAADAKASAARGERKNDAGYGGNPPASIGEDDLFKAEQSFKLLSAVLKYCNS